MRVQLSDCRLGGFVAMLSVAVLATLPMGCGSSPPSGSGAVDKEEYKLVYPNTRRSDHVDEYHGTKVADPYQWLEDPDSAETRAWIEAQNKVTFGYLDRIPQRNKIRERLTKLWDYERYGLPLRRGDRYFYEHNNGLQNQSVLYVADSLDAEPRVLLDPNEWSEDGTIHLTDWRVSEDGKHLAYGQSTAGSDWQQWKVLEIDTGRLLLDHLRWIKFSTVSWTPDSKGFFYSRYDEPKEGEALTGANYYQKLYYHPLGEPQHKDTLVYERKDEKEWGFDGEVTEDGRYLIISVWRGTEEKNLIFYKELENPDSPVVELITGWDWEYQFIGNDGSVFWFVTDLDAPRRRVIAVDTAQPEREHWREVIPQTDNVLRQVSEVGERFFAVYLQDAKSLVRVHQLDGAHERDVELPAIGSAGGFGGRRDHTETFYSFTNFTTPASILRYDIASGESTVFRRPKVDFNPQAFVTEQVFYESRDGTRVPMFVTYKKGFQPSGNAPTILYGYGGFNIPLTPGYSVGNLVWLEAGGVYAVPNLRGGGEYGREWHEAGMKEKKQNVFDDFIAAAEWLVENKYTDREHLAIRGRSNGGLLVGAAMTQRPELFAAASPGVGVLDMLRYHKFTIGWAWVSEYGSADDADECKTLLAYSPLHNLKPGTRYPATIITTGDHDDRVVPAHSFKFAAALQAAQSKDGPPTLIRIETSAGHGAGKPTAKIIEESADEIAFLASILGLTY